MGKRATWWSRAAAGKHRVRPVSPSSLPSTSSSSIPGRLCRLSRIERPPRLSIDTLVDTTPSSPAAPCDKHLTPSCSVVRPDAACLVAGPDVVRPYAACLIAAPDMLSWGSVCACEAVAMDQISRSVRDTTALWPEKQQGKSCSASNSNKQHVELQEKTGAMVLQHL